MLQRGPAAQTDPGDGRRRVESPGTADQSSEDGLPPQGDGRGSPPVAPPARIPRTKDSMPRFDRHVDQLELALPEPAPEGWLARELSAVDRELAGRQAREVVVRARANRSTLGSLRAGPDGLGWRFTVARRLVDESPGDALLLGRILLHRLRRRPVPAAWSRRLAELRRNWSTPGETSAAPAESDPLLAVRLAAIARLAAPELPAERLPAIRWQPSRSRRVLGRYRPDRHDILLHAALDDPKVPDAVLDDLIHHELLHALLGPVRQGGRVVHHHAEFRRRERAWPGHATAEAWCRRHLRRFLR